ncbi:MAG: heavy-metal-associated domain-containing protein [Desulfonatronovibrionaceae bacterium]
MTTIKIQGMSCQHCARAVENALSQIEGVSQVKVSLEHQEAAFKAPAGLDMNLVKKKVEEEGYKVVD